MKIDHTITSFLFYLTALLERFPGLCSIIKLSLIHIYGDLFTSRTESELLYLLKALENIKESGKLVTVFTTGAAFRSSGMLARKYLVENNYVEGIIFLPARTLGFTAIPIDLWILKKDQKKSNVIKMLDASNRCV